MKKISNLAPGLAALLIAGSPAAQPAYPEKPIRYVGFAPGGPPDISHACSARNSTSRWDSRS